MNLPSHQATVTRGVSLHAMDRAEVRFTDGRVKEIVFVASRLERSGALEVSLVRNRHPETLARAMRDHFEAFGGVPRRCLLEPSASEPEGSSDTRVRWEAALGALRGLGANVEPCSAQRGASLGDWVRRALFGARPFTDRADLQRDMSARSAVLYPETYEAVDERADLGPLRVGRDDFALLFDVRVGRYGQVFVAGRRYRVPREAANARGVALLYASVVRVIAEGTEVVLPRHGPVA